MVRRSEQRKWQPMQKGPRRKHSHPEPLRAKYNLKVKQCKCKWGKCKSKWNVSEGCKLKFHSTSTLLIMICPSLVSWSTLLEPFTLRCKSFGMVRSSFLSTIIATQFLSNASIVYSFPLFFFYFKPLLLLPLSTLSLPGSLPSVCLWARGAGCYLDDLVQEGEREFISCLPPGLCYLWCFNAILLNNKNKIKSHIHPWRSTAAEGRRFTPCIWRRVQVLRVAVDLWACDSSSTAGMVDLYSETWWKWT